MTTTLSTTTYKAVKQAIKQADKAESKRASLPIMETLLLRTHDGHLLVTPFCWGDKIERAKRTQPVPARVEHEFETCIPARPFRDWLYATMPTKEEKARNVSEQITFDFDACTQTVTIKAGNTKAQFKCVPASEFPAV